MYDFQFAPTRCARRSPRISFVACAAALVLSTAGVTRAQDASDSVIRKISGTNEKLELSTNTSRILTLDKNIPRVQVNNPELLAVTPLSATQVQISAKKAGVTQVNLWDDAGGVHTVDVQIYGDARELQLALQTQFPNSSVKVYRYSESLVLNGFVDRPDHVGPIMRLAEDYAPKVINNINVGGVQQILLKVKVMEISRTKLRQLDTNFAVLGSNGGFFASAPSGLLTSISHNVGSIQSVTGAAPLGGPTAAEFGIVHNNNAFFGFLNWLQENQIAKVRAEPNIVAVSGRPSQFQDGGETPIPVPQSLGTTTIEFKPFGTIVDFLPIVLGNGNIRLEVRPQVIDADYSHAVTVNGITIPAFNTRKVDTAVEMKAGQTFALAGLVQELTTTNKTGLPYISDVPVLGVPFRKTSDTVEEKELLIVVTPEIVDALDSCEMSCEGPGTGTTSPTSRGLYCAGQMEVPAYCNPTQGLGACGQDPCDHCSGSSSCNGGCATCNHGMSSAMTPAGSGDVALPGGTGYDNSPEMSAPSSGPSPAIVPPHQDASPLKMSPAPAVLPPPAQHGAQTSPEDISLPVEVEDHTMPPQAKAATPAIPVVEPKPVAAPAALPPQAAPPAPAAPITPVAPADPSIDEAAVRQGGTPMYTTPRPYSPQRQPVFVRNASRPYNPQVPSAQPAAALQQNGLIGPSGYDVQ
ncbi:MAG TPA: pilus assembly protein N-terminal domain-containing protein [Lacipirellulaceae bacterium]|nr:pilus assembly protein N-terminal domain-containing protein [Lacipirellulaceae bacterium]